MENIYLKVGVEFCGREGVEKHSVRHGPQLSLEN